MIQRIFIPLLLAIMLSDLYIDLHYWRRRGYPWWKRVLWWVPSVVMMAYTLALASVRNFVPDDLLWVNLYMALVALVVYPKAVFSLFSLIGRGVRRLTHTRRNWGTPVATVFIIVTLLMGLYGSTLGFRELKVRHIDLTFSDLPAAFDGYRIVHFSDAHVGTFNGSLHHLLERDVDSINAQHADLIAFTGDLQNLQPAEIEQQTRVLGRLRARDGVVSVLGNHDYAEYVDVSPRQAEANIRLTRALERQCGWRLLLNRNVAIRRGQDSIFIMGEENLEKPDSADFRQSMAGIPPRAFVIAMQHNPRAWDRHIRADRRCKLTLSGHTHGGQASVFGLRATQIAYREDYGLYRQGRQYLYVTSGLGGLIPFRFGMPPEIAVITLHRARAAH